MIDIYNIYSVDEYRKGSFKHPGYVDDVKDAESSYRDIKFITSRNDENRLRQLFGIDFFRNDRNIK